MLRKYRIISVGSKKRLLIDFEDEKYEILSIFLESDVIPFEEWVKERFSKVLSGESQYEEVNGNVCGAEINSQTTKINDNLAYDGEGVSCIVDTKELYEIIVEWCEKVKEFLMKIHKTLQ